ncbi:hypothetical protein CIP106467_2338 [Citrobacter europaeus]|nr:hypothetical protein CIP106467_2338 [Citrobacter europaeus]
MQFSFCNLLNALRGPAESHNIQATLLFCKLTFKFNEILFYKIMKCSHFSFES